MASFYHRAFWPVYTICESLFLTQLFLHKIINIHNLSPYLLHVAHTHSFACILQSLLYSVYQGSYKFNLVMVVWFWAQANFCYCPSCSKNATHFVSGQEWLKKRSNKSPFPVISSSRFVSLNPWDTLLNKIFLFFYRKLKFLKDARGTGNRKVVVCWHHRNVCIRFSVKNNEWLMSYLKERFVCGE